MQLRSTKYLKLVGVAVFCLSLIQMSRGQIDQNAPGGPTIVSPPEDQSVFIGQNVSLNVFARSLAKNVSISGDGRIGVFDAEETTGTISIDYNFFVVPDQLRLYYGSGTNSLAYDTGLISGSGTVNLNYGPGTETLFTVFMNPEGQSDFTVWDYLVSTSLPINYQWRRNGVDIPGATNTIYSITNAQLSHSGVYSISVSNVLGQAVGSVKVRVLDPATPPALVSSLATDTVIVSWPTNYVGYNLETTSNLQLTNSWATVSGPYEINATDWTITTSLSGNGYYRLRKP